MDPSPIILHKNPEGDSRVSIVCLTHDITMDAYLATCTKNGTWFKVVRAQDLPDGDFFDAWMIDSKDNVVVDIEQAKNIHRDRLRVHRNKQFPDLDIQFMRAVERGDTAKQKEIGTMKQKLRDVPTHPAIAAATTVEELRALTLEVLLAM